MRIEIDSEKETVTIDGELVFKKELTVPTVKNLADMFNLYYGDVEYAGIVAEIQKWYYGRLVKASWCATSLSYFSHILGLQEQTGKHENVDRMKDYMQKRNMLDCTSNYGGGKYTPKRGDVCFMSDKYKFADCTHVGVIDTINNVTGDCKIISGNCDNAIKTKSYNYKTNKYIVAWGRII